MNEKDLIVDCYDLKSKVGLTFYVSDNIEYKLIDVEYKKLEIIGREYIKMSFKDIQTGYIAELQVNIVNGKYGYTTDRGLIISSTREGYAKLIKNYLYGKHLENKPRTLASILFGKTKPDWDKLLGEKLQ